MLLTLPLSLAFVTGCDKRPDRLSKSRDKKARWDMPPPPPVIRDVIDWPAGVLDAGVLSDAGSEPDVATADVPDASEGADVSETSKDVEVHANPMVQSKIVVEHKRRVEEIHADSKELLELIRARRRGMTPEEYRKWKLSRAKLLKKMEQHRRKHKTPRPPSPKKKRPE